MSPVAALPRTQFLSLYMKRVPVIFTWAVGVGAFMGWPHAVYFFSNKAHHVPKINKLLI